MRNEDYFEYIKKQSFEEKLRAFADSMERMTRCSYESCYGPSGDRDYFRKECEGQRERAEWLFENLRERKSDIHAFISWLQETKKIDLNTWKVLDDFADEYEEVIK